MGMELVFAEQVANSPFTDFKLRIGNDFSNGGTGISCG